MGKKKTVTVSGEPEKKAVGSIGLKGGERIKTIEAGPIVKETNEEGKKTKKQAKPKTRSKKYQGAAKTYDKAKKYSLSEAIGLVKKVSYSKFDGTVELHINTNKEITTKVEPPHSTGKQKRIEFATADTIEKLKLGKIDFDVLLATPETMPKLVPFAKLLGPRGLMPNPKNGTLVKSADAAKKFSGSSIDVKTQKQANVVHTIVGKVSQKDKELEDNAKAVFSAIGVKNIISSFIKPTMGPSIKINIE